MPAYALAPNPQFAVEMIYRGLYASLMRDPSLRDSLIMYLPYYVLYEGDTYRVILIHPEESLEIEFPHTGPARDFLTTNEKLIAHAKQVGRDPKSIIHRRVSQDPSPDEPKQGGYIDPTNVGNIQYRILKQMAKEEAEKRNEVLPEDIEYDVETSSPHVYPVVGILRQKADGQHGKIIGLVSMDFEDRLSEKVAAVFNSFMESFTLNVWDFPPGKSIPDYFKDIKMSDTPYQARGKDGLKFHDPPVGPEFDFSDRLDPLKKALTSRDYERLESYLEGIERHVTEAKEVAARQHRLLRALHDPRKIDPLLLWLASETFIETSAETRDERIRAAVKTTEHYKLGFRIDSDHAKTFFLRFVELMNLWPPSKLWLAEHNKSVAFCAEFRQSNLNEEELFRNLVVHSLPEEKGFRTALQNLAIASSRMGEGLAPVPETRWLKESTDLGKLLKYSNPHPAILACVLQTSDGAVLRVFMRGDFEPE
jgi:hypothetical protein